MVKKNDEQVPIIKDFYVFGTLIQLKVFGENANVAIDESIKRLLEIDDKMSVFKEDSEILKINRNAGGEYQGISEDTYYVLEISLKYSDMSKGALELTIRPLVDVWRFGRENQRVSNKVFKIQFKLNTKWDLILKSYKYILLAFIVNFIWTKGSTLFETSSPWDAFAQLPRFSDAISQYTIGSIFLVVISIGAMFIERFFLQILCFKCLDACSKKILN